MLSLPHALCSVPFLWLNRAVRKFSVTFTKYLRKGGLVAFSLYFEVTSVISLLPVWTDEKQDEVAKSGTSSPHLVLFLCVS